MAKFITSFLVGAVSGSIGGSTMRLAKTGQVLAQRQPTRKNLSPGQMATKAAFTRAGQAWRLLDEGTHRAWFTAAQSRPKRDRLGSTRTLSGYQLFIGQSAFNDGTPYATSYLPPVNTTPPFSVLTLAPIGANFVLSWTLAVNPGTTTRFHVSGYRPGIVGPCNYARNWTHLYTQTSGVSGSVIINPPSWTNSQAYTPGEGIRIRIRGCTLNAWLAGWNELSAVFV